MLINVLHGIVLGRTFRYMSYLGSLQIYIKSSGVVQVYTVDKCKVLLQNLKVKNNSLKEVIILFRENYLYKYFLYWNRTR